MKNPYRSALLLLSASIVLALSAHAATQPALDTSCLPAKPEVLTYRSISKQGDGLYQLSLLRSADGIEFQINIITPGFNKSVWGRMTTDLQPRESRSRIYVHDQVSLTTTCDYSPDKLHITTTVGPYQQVTENTLSLTGLVIDFSQTPLLARCLPYGPDASFQFDSVNPQTNTLVPLTFKVIGEDTVLNIACYKVASHDFEGDSVLWVEKSGTHRVLRIEQPKTGRVTELTM
jgi:hypothetical protein